VFEVFLAKVRRRMWWLPGGLATKLPCAFPVIVGWHKLWHVCTCCVLYKQPVLLVYSTRVYLYVEVELVCALRYFACLSLCAWCTTEQESYPGWV